MGFISVNLVLFGLSQIGLYRQNEEEAKALAIITVDSVLDDADAVPGDGVCDITGSTGDGPCTLRAAIQEANTESEAVDIGFSIEQYTNSVINLSDNLQSGEGTGSSAYGKSRYDSTGKYRSIWKENTGARGNTDTYLFDSAASISANNPFNLSNQLQVGEGTGGVGTKLELDIDESNNTLVVWDETAGLRGSFDVYLYRSNLAISASNPLNLSNQLPTGEGEDFVNDLALSHDSDNNVYVAWTEDPGGEGDADAYLYNSSLPLSSSNPLNLSETLGAGEQQTLTTYAAGIELMVSAGNEVFVIWEQEGGAQGGSDIYLYRSGLSLTPDVNPVNLSLQLPTSETDSDAYFQNSYFDSDGELHLVWIEYETGLGFADVFYYESGQAFSINNPINISSYIKPGEGAYAASSANITISSNNTVFISWGESQGARGDMDTYLYRNDQALSSSNPLNLSDQLPLGEGTGAMGGPDIVSYGTNNAYVLWTEPTGGKGGEDIYLFNTNLSLSPSNPLNLSSLLSAGEGLGNVQIFNLFTDINDEAIAVWGELTGTRGVNDMYLYRSAKSISATNPLNLSELTSITEGTGDVSFIPPTIDSFENKILVNWDEATGLQGGRDRYIFEETDIGKDGYTIAPYTNLPDITKSDVTIDASTQPGADCSTGTVKIKLDGTNLTINKNGLTVDSSNATIKGFSFVDFAEFGGSGLKVFPGSDASIYCNLVGLDADGTTINGNYYGIVIESTGSAIIGDGTPGGRNIISGNSSAGVMVSNSSSVVMKGNYLGTDKTGTVAKSNLYGVTIGTSATSSTIGGTNGLDPDNSCTGDCNLISGNTITGITIMGYEPGDNGDGTDRVNVLGNFIGTNITGDGAIPNAVGIQNIYGDSVNIGGTDSASRNVISGNTGGMSIYANVVQAGQLIKDLHIRNNFIGTTSDGTSALGNSNDGIAFFDLMPEAIISGNVISGNGGNGIESDFDYVDVPVDSMSITENKIGTRPDGTNDIGNQLNGIKLLGKGSVNIGATDQGNVIKNSGDYGIQINEDPSLSLPEDPISSIVATITNNTISDNSQSGVLVYNNDSIVNNNTIQGNTSSGIEFVSGSKFTAIGNNIYGSTLRGIHLVSVLNPSGAYLSENIITFYPAISLGSFKNSNDLNDVDTGPNNYQNYPELQSAELQSGVTRIYGTFNSESNTYYKVEAFAFDQPPFTQPSANTYIGSTIIQTDGSGNYDFSTSPIIISNLPMNPFYKITTTATKCNDSACTIPIETSELSDGVEAIILAPPATETPTPTNTPVPTLTETPIPTDTPVPGPTNTPVPGATATAIPTSTNTPLPTATSTPLPTSTNTPVPTATNTPVPTPTSTIIPTTTFIPLNPTRTPVPGPTNSSENPVETTPSVTPVPTETSTPTPSIYYSTTDATNTLSSRLTPIPTTTPVLDALKGSYVYPEESVMNIPIVKSTALSISKRIEQITQDSPVMGSVLNASLGVTERIMPLTDNLSYLLSLQFVGVKTAIAGVSAVNLMALAGPALATAFSQPKILYYALAWFWKRKNKQPWGILVDKVTNAPIAFARVILTQDGKIISTQTSDLQGKYGFALNKGLYQVFISHSDYIEHQEQIEIRFDGENISQDFELSPRSHDDFTDNMRWSFYSVKKLIRKNLFVLNTLMFSLGFVYTLFAVTNALTILNYAILSMYILQIILIVTFYLIKDKDFGQVLDTSTGEPVVGAIVRLYDNERQLDVTITDSRGRYNFLLDPGTYYIKVSCGGYVFPTQDASNIITNKVGEKLLKFNLQDSQKVNIKLYMQKFANVHVSRQAILSPFS